VILGAGSTIHACAPSCAPSTEEITKLVCKIEDEPTHSVVSRLRDQRTEGNFNFETVLAALEDLDEFSVRRRCPTAVQSIGGHLSAFTELLPDFAKVEENRFQSARASLVGRIKDFVICRTDNRSPAKLKIFFDLLKAEFDLTVLTLNYDDLIDRAGEWYDGFNPPTAPDRSGRFDFSGFSAQSTKHPAVLLHLHGSVRFAFPPMRLPTPQESGELVRHTAPVRGIGATVNPPQEIAQPSPIIAGDGKDRWMTRACVPFGYYYNAFITSILDCPSLLVAGYGGADPHVNSWLKEEHPRIHGARRRIVQINPALPKSPRSRELLTLGGSEGNFPPQDPKQIREIIGYLKSA
jgi:hypothetical protein